MLRSTIESGQCAYASNTARPRLIMMPSPATTSGTDAATIVPNTNSNSTSVSGTMRRSARVASSVVAARTS